MQVQKRGVELGKVSKPFQRSPRTELCEFKETLGCFIIADPYTEKEQAAGQKPARRSR
jgi:hypothetical protein